MASEEFLYGLHSVELAIKRDKKRIKRVYLLHASKNAKLQKIIQLCKAHHIAFEMVDKLFFTQYQLEKVNHQGVTALVEAKTMGSEADLKRLLENLSHEPLILLLDGVTDPHNLGACLRTANAAGVDALVVPKDRSVGLNATACKVASGAADVTPVFQVTNLNRTIDYLKSLNIWLYGTAGEVKDTLYTTTFTGGVALVMGSEGEGLRQSTRSHCDFLIKIPMLGQVSSLNVSVATGVVLFEVVRQRVAQ
ncbi:MAG: 23S rRNA (guanosine(2251)-2'-O)-methyltransferase RlmB [Pseudomonadota bacterium]